MAEIKDSQLNGNELTQPINGLETVLPSVPQETSPITNQKSTNVESMNDNPVRSREVNSTIGNDFQVPQKSHYGPNIISSYEGTKWMNVINNKVQGSEEIPL